VIQKSKINPIGPNIHLGPLKHLSNPYPIYKLWREQHPVFQLESNGFWAVCKYDDVCFALKYPDLFSSTAVKDLFQPEWLDKKYWRNLFFLIEDPPEHTAHRMLVSKEFAKETIELLVPFMRRTTKGLLNKIIPHQKIEFIQDFAYPCIGNLIDHIVGTEDSLSLKEVQLQPKINEKNLSREPDPDHIVEIERNIQNKIDYFNSLIQKRREKPEKDLISKLISAEVDGVPLTDDMISNAVELLLLAGTHGPVHSLSHVMIQMSRRPDLFKRLQIDPHLIPAFIEESLRYSSVAPMVFRRTKQAVTLSGVTIPEGEMVMLFLASANRDPDIFSDPDDFDIGRSNIHKHIAFGYGPHQCLGAHLTRVKIRVVLECILKNFNGISCPDDDQMEWNSWMVNSVNALPMSFY